MPLDSENLRANFGKKLSCEKLFPALKFSNFKESKGLDTFFPVNFCLKILPLDSQQFENLSARFSK